MSENLSTLISMDITHSHACQNKGRIKMGWRNGRETRPLTGWCPTLEPWLTQQMRHLARSSAYDQPRMQQPAEVTWKVPPAKEQEFKRINYRAKTPGFRSFSHQLHDSGEII